MLTNLYYFHHYKAFLIHSAESESDNMLYLKKGRIADKCIIQRNKEGAFILNKSSSSEVVEYLKNITNSVLQMKSACGDMLFHLKFIDSNIYPETSNSLWNQLSQLVETFVSTYNTCTKTLLTQTHSPLMKEVAEKMIESVEECKDTLEVFGIQKDEDDWLQFNSDRIFKNDGKIDFQTEKFMLFCEESLEYVSCILKQPLTQHMTFQPLRFYYNYEYAEKVEQSFKVMYPGMLIDVAV